MKSLVRVFLLLLVIVAARETDIKAPDTPQASENKEEAVGQKISKEEPIELGYKKIKYDRKYMDMYTDEMIWSGNVLPQEGSITADDGSGYIDRVTYFDDEFFDKFIVDRWTSEWLAGDTTWVIGMTAPIAYKASSYDHAFGLIARSITILSDHFYNENNNVRFGIVNYYEHELIKETLYGRGPCIWVLKNGMGYRNRPMSDSYQ